MLNPKYQDRCRGSAFSIVTLTRHVRQREINLADEERSTRRRNAVEDPDVPGDGAASQSCTTPEQQFQQGAFTAQSNHEG
ncbi:hypothetical protein UY3_08634 [Chelonia mydas]|uniref:Uncharacterized protein n=1 Tax=Chelonia mydas TaxID=8469 RepID=M7BF41_CHEMY|nr:hypothetical protein UY3_08634 [Chelonia mydas]